MLYGYLIVTLFILTIFSLNIIDIVLAHQQSFNETIENYDGQIENKLDKIIELLEESGEGSITSLYITTIVFMLGLAFVIFGLYIGQEQKLSRFTRRLYLSAFFALIIPVTIIVIQYIVETLLIGELNEPVLTIAFILLIPITSSYVLMIVKTMHRTNIQPDS